MPTPLCIPLVMGSSLPLPRAAIHPGGGRISPVLPKSALETPQEKTPGTSVGRGSSYPRWDGAHTGVGCLGLGDPQLQSLPVRERRGVHPGGGNQSRRWQQELSETSEAKPRAPGAAVGGEL